MTASLHLARFGPSGALRTLGRMARLGAPPGAAVARVFMLADLEPRTGGLVRPTRFGLFCGWESAAARDDFEPERFTRDARESWSVSLDTVRVRKGGLGGWVPDTEGVAPFARDEPALVMTHARLRARWPAPLHRRQRAHRARDARRPWPRDDDRRRRPSPHARDLLRLALTG